jgi:hypothetical protein
MPGGLTERWRDRPAREISDPDIDGVVYVMLCNFAASALGFFGGTCFAAQASGRSAAGIPHARGKARDNWTDASRCGVPSDWGLLRGAHGSQEPGHK